MGRVVRNNAAGGQRASRVSFSAWQAVKKMSAYPGAGEKTNAHSSSPGSSTTSAAAADRKAEFEAGPFGRLKISPRCRESVSITDGSADSFRY